MPLDQTILTLDSGSDGSTRVCDRYGIRCPASCNGWNLPCEDDANFEDSVYGDLRASKGVITAILISAIVWLLIVYCYV